MKNILILGAGLSTNILIDYLLKNSVEYNWHVTIADINEDLAKQKLNGHSNGKALAFNIEDDELTVKAIADNDIVISMLPAFMHKKIALKCIDMRKPMLTASYASDDIKELNDKAKKSWNSIVHGAWFGSWYRSYVCDECHK